MKDKQEQDQHLVDERSEKNIATLHTDLQPIARDFVNKAKTELNIVCKITSGTRTYAEQDALFKQGNVTRSRGGYSNHNFGVAFDVTIFEDGQPKYESPQYRELGKLGKSLGLSWGGDWKSFQDEPHFELRPEWASNLSEKDMLAEFRNRVAQNKDILAA